MPKHTCNCPSPGGTVQCEPGQLAMCSRIGGKIKASCTTPPKNTSGVALRNWILHQVTQKSRRPNQHLDNQDLLVLRNKKYQSGGDETTFDFDFTDDFIA